MPHFTTTKQNKLYHQYSQYHKKQLYSITVLYIWNKWLYAMGTSSYCTMDIRAGAWTWALAFIKFWTWRMHGTLYLHFCMCFYDTVLKCILPSMTLRIMKLKPLEYFVNALHYPFSIHSWRNNISWICVLITPNFLRLRKQVTINIVVAVLPSVLLN